MFCGAPESYVYSALRSVNMEQTNIDLNKIVGANLKRAIKESKWKTQEKFSEAFGAEVRTVGRWCNQA